MVYACSKCGGSARPVKINGLFSVRCCNDRCINARPYDKKFYLLMFAFQWWNRLQIIDIDFAKHNKEYFYFLERKETKE